MYFLKESLGVESFISSGQQMVPESPELFVLVPKLPLGPAEQELCDKIIQALGYTHLEIELQVASKEALERSVDTPTLAFIDKDSGGFESSAAPLVVTHSLTAILADTNLKKEVWQQIQPLKKK